jgi:hypothetical protein
LACQWCIVQFLVGVQKVKLQHQNEIQEFLPLSGKTWAAGHSLPGVTADDENQRTSSASWQDPQEQSLAT